MPVPDVDRYRADDRRAVDALYRRVFGTDAAESSRLRWEWQYRRNPNNPGGEPEIWVAQAQLAGWLEGLIHAIQAVLWAQHVETRAQLDEMRRRGALNDPGDSDEREPKKPVPSGQYL